MTPMDEAWLVLKCEGGFFTQPPMQMDEKRLAEYEKGRDSGVPYSAHLGDDYYNALYQQEEVAALNEVIRQELRRQMHAKDNFTSSTYMPDASPMMQMREHNFPKVGEPLVPRQVPKGLCDATLQGAGLLQACPPCSCPSDSFKVYARISHEYE